MKGAFCTESCKCDSEALFQRPVSQGAQMGYLGPCKRGIAPKGAPSSDVVARKQIGKCEI